MAFSGGHVLGCVPGQMADLRVMHHFRGHSIEVRDSADCFTSYRPAEKYSVFADCILAFLFLDG